MVLRLIEIVVSVLGDNRGDDTYKSGEQFLSSFRP